MTWRLPPSWSVTVQWNPEQRNDVGKLDSCQWVCSCELLIPVLSATSSVVSPFFDHLPCYPDGKCPHNPGDYSWLCPPKSYVLLPQELVFPGDRFQLDYCAQDAGDPDHPGHNHLLPWLCYPDVLLLLLWSCWVLPAGHHGVWPLRGHLWPFALSSHHGSQSLWPAGSCLLVLRIPSGYCANHMDFQLPFLWPQQGEPLLLWQPPCDRTGLCWYLSVWTGSSNSYCPIHPLPFLVDPGILCPHPLHYLQDALSRGEAQGLLHLLLPPAGCLPLLQHCHPHILSTPVQQLSWEQEAVVTLLHRGDSHVEPHHLQLEE